MVRKALALLVVAAVVGVALGAAGLWIPGLVGADGHSASRSFPDGNSIVAGGELTVQLTARDYGSIGARVVETLPEGFEYQASSLPAAQVVPDQHDPQIITFAVVLEPSPFTLTYTVTAPDMADTYEFSGTIEDIPQDQDGETRVTGGSTDVMVEAAPVTEGPRASRMISPAPVTEGGNIRVTITAMDYGVLGAVVETMPPGFNYVAGSSTIADPEEEGRKLNFALLTADQATFSYSVTAAAVVGTHTFTGQLIDGLGQRDSHAVGGENMVTVQPRVVPGAPRAERSFSMAMTGLGDEVTVTITAMNYGQIGVVVETIPMGFTYVMDSSSLADVEMDGRELTFALLTPNSATFSYKVMTADTAGDYDFSGNLVDDQQMMHAVAGESRITAGPTAMRSFSGSTVMTGDSLEVTITARDYGSFGAVVETLPNGFAYVSSALADVEEEGNELTFALLDANSASFMYTVRAPSAAGSYDFMGRLIDDAQMSHDVGGATSVTVQAPATPTPTARPQRRRRGGGGGGYAPLPVATATPMPTRAPSAAVPTIAPTPIIVPTIIAPTPEPEPTAVPPTAVPTPRPTAIVMVPTVAPTQPPEPTAMPKPTAVPPTAVPPTEVPPTAMVEPTEPPAPTATTAPTVAPVTPVTPTDDGMPVWLIILIIVIIAAVVIGAVGFYVMRMRR